MRTLEAKILDSTHLELGEPISGQPGHHVKISIRDDEEEDSPETTTEQRPDASADRESAPHLSGPHRERELAWRRSHAEVLRAYEGQWVILEGEEIVAHGRHPAKLVEQARAKGIRIPYLFFVEESRPDVVRLGL